MLGWPVYLFLIDDTASSGKLIWSNNDSLANNGNLLLPICKIDESAGVATFTIKNESASASLLQQMQTVVVIGNFEKLGCQQGESAIDINKDSLTNLVRSACPLLNEITGLALRDSRPLIRPFLSRIPALAMTTSQASLSHGRWYPMPTTRSS